MSMNFNLMISIERLLAVGVVPDPLIRAGIRRFVAQTLREKNRGVELQKAALLAHIDELKKSPIAIQTHATNEQHYELPIRFYQGVLGPRLKYSAGYWSPDVLTLQEAEERMLAITCARAEISDGLRILELGCGWGSLTIWMAEHYPQSIITAVSNSRSQKEYIDAEAQRRGFKNLLVIAADLNDFDMDETFDRVVSIEMFERIKNYQLLLAQIARWLVPEGKLFVQSFTHRRYAYHFEDKGPNDWLTRYFFTGGQMPSDDLLLYFQDDLRIEKHWNISGMHYEKTARAWLRNMRRHRAEIWPLFLETYGAENAKRWWTYWRVFFMTCAELWGYRGGEEWIVSHYRFRKP